MRNSRGIYFWVLLLLMIAGTVYFNRRAIQIGYHDFAMQQAWQRYFSFVPDPGEELFTQSDRYEVLKRFDHHRQELVHLGGMIEKDYDFKHLRSRSPEAKHFIGLVLKENCPSREYFESPSLESPQPLRCTFWFYPEYLEEWNTFIQEHDIEDYSDKFMKDTILEL